MNNKDEYTMKYQCELCHEHAAKHQYFDPDGKELYVCDNCFAEHRHESVDEKMQERRDFISAMMILMYDKLLDIMSENPKLDNGFKAYGECGDNAAQIEVTMDKGDKSILFKCHSKDKEVSMTRTWKFFPPNDECKEYAFEGNESYHWMDGQQDLTVSFTHLTMSPDKLQRIVSAVTAIYDDRENMEPLES